MYYSATTCFFKRAKNLAFVEFRPNIFNISFLIILPARMKTPASQLLLCKNQVLDISFKMQTLFVDLLFGLLLLAVTNCASFITDSYVAAMISNGGIERKTIFCKAIGGLGGSIFAVQW